MRSREKGPFEEEGDYRRFEKAVLIVNKLRKVSLHKLKVVSLDL